MNKSVFSNIAPLLGLFIAVSSIGVLCKTWLEIKDVNLGVLLTGNLLLFIVSLTAFLITQKAVSSSKPQAFVRAMYGSFMIKFFVLAIAAFIYIMIAKKEVNKPALVACAALYILYTGIEIRSLMKLLKQKKNA